MTDADAVLVRILAAQDAIRLPIRDWSSNRANANRTQFRMQGGIPYRARYADDAGRKQGERALAKLAAEGLLNVAKGARVKFPLVALTPAGDARTRALINFPDRAEGREFLVELVALSERSVPYGDVRWVAEVEFNDGRGWDGPKTAREDRRMLSYIELEYLAAAAAGWVYASSTLHGHVGYRATEGGLVELKSPAPVPDFGPLPECDPDAGRLYRKEQDAWLESMQTEEPADSREVGECRLSPAAFDTIDATDDDPARPRKKPAPRKPKRRR